MDFERENTLNEVVNLMHGLLVLFYKALPFQQLANEAS